MKKEMGNSEENNAKNKIENNAENNIENNTENNTLKKGRIKEAAIHLLSFVLPMLLMALIWGAKGITYGGRVTLLLSDMKHQLMPYIASLRYLLQDPGGIFWNWNISLGGNFVGTYAYYLADPLNWITLLFDLKQMPEAVYVITLLKIGLCGLSFSVFARYGLAKDRAYFYNIVFACCYALMSYNILYSFCLMWLDGIYFLPLILLGIERMLEGKKGWVYLFSLAGLLWCNYYITYMVGIFAGGYLLCRILMEFKKGEWKKYLGLCVRFALCTAAAFGLTAPLLLPAVRDAAGNYRLEDWEMQHASGGFSLFRLLQKFLPQQYDSIMSAEGLPSIYCGSIVLVLAIVFLFQKWELRRKLGYLFLFLLPFSGFVFDAADYAWHGFRYPTNIPYRYAFLCPMALLMMAYAAFRKLDREKDIVGLLLVVGALYTGAELFMNGSVIVGGLNREASYTVRLSYDVAMSMCEPLADAVKEDTRFGRVGAEGILYGENETAMYGLKGLNCFNSCFDQDVNTFLEAMGCPNKSAPVTFGFGRTPFLDSVLGVRYVVGGDGHEGLYREVTESTYENFTVKLWENPDALSLGYVAEADGLGAWTPGSDVFQNQNRWIEALGYEGAAPFRSVACEVEKGEDGEYRVRFTAPSDQRLYLCFDGTVEDYYDESGRQKKYKMWLDEKGIASEEMEFIGKCRGLGRFEAGESHEVRVECEIDELRGVYLYELDEEAYGKAMDWLKGRQLRIADLRNGRVAGEIASEGGGVLLTTLPYDEGYRVRLDGERVNYSKEFGTFLAVRVPDGAHRVEIVYEPPGLRAGIGIFAGTVLLWAGAGAALRLKKPRKNGQV